ncbi:MAG: hypothetical protein WCS65_03455 [Verrucomicrobiae bacterium]
MQYNPGSLPQIVFSVGNPVRTMSEGIGMNAFLGRDRYYPQTSDHVRWEQIGHLMDEARPGFLRIGYLEGSETEGDVSPWDDLSGSFDLSHDLWRKLEWFDAWCARHEVSWMLDPWWVPRSMQVSRPGGGEIEADASGKANWRGAPRDPAEYAERYIRPLIRHLRHDLKLKQLRWLGLFNEPIWGKLTRDPENFFVGDGACQVRVLARTYAEVRRVLDEDGESSLGLIGPGHLCSWQMPPLDFMASGADPSASLAAWDMHAYFQQPDWVAETSEDFVNTHSFLQQTIRRWVDFASLQGKPFFVTEMGTFFYGRPFWGERDYETSGSHSSAIHDAQFIVRAINEGVDGFLRWALCVDPTVDGRWSLIEWVGGEAPVAASPSIYPAYRALMRAIPPRSTILSWRASFSDGLTPRVHGCAIVTPQGSRRVVLVHDRPGRNSDVLLCVPPEWAGIKFRRTIVDEMRKGIEAAPVEVPESLQIPMMITPFSITVLEEDRPV